MEPHPGLFVSTTSTDEWEPDPDVPGSDFHELVHDGNVWAGLTRFSSVDGPATWTPEQRETVHILEGSVRIQVKDGPMIELGVGDLASFPAGLEMEWDITAPFKELWVFG